MITAPRGSALPMAPNKKNILLVAFALGLLVPAVIIFMQENMNTKVRGKKDLENLSVPYLGEIPLYSNNKKKKNKSQEKQSWWKKAIATSSTKLFVYFAPTWTL